MYPLWTLLGKETIVTVSGHDALIAAIKGAENEIRLVKVEPENPQQTGVCSLANALLTVKEA